MNDKIDWKRKLTSRKLWLSVASFVSMLIIALTGEKETAVQISALVMAGATIIGYALGEGLADSGNTYIDNFQNNNVESEGGMNDK